MSTTFIVIGTGVVLQLIGGGTYAWETFAGRVKPNRVTFALWAAAPLIATAAAVVNGVGWIIVPVFMSGFVPLLVLIASFANKGAYWKLGSFDYICGLFAILALALWAITNQPTVAIIFSIIADAFAAAPTLKKAWTNPETESGWPYATTIVSATLGLTLVQHWYFSEYAFSIYLILICSAIFFTVYRHRIYGYL